jgi:WD40 repeat protein
MGPGDQPDSPHGESTAFRTSDPTRSVPGFAPGRVIGERYEIRTFLGEGGMGEVWLAIDMRLRVEVALKALRRERSGDDQALDRLRREVRAARVVASPNVCRIFDLVEAEGEELVSMEYVEGMTLAEVLRRRGPLDLPEAAGIAAQFLAGLEAIHQAGLVHRDVKPENIMLTRTGRVVLMDFGLAKPATDDLDHSIAGTRPYMAPESLQGRGLHATIDIFAAGLVLAEMISVGGSGGQTTREDLWAGAREEPPRLPDGLWRPVLLRAIACDPASRHPSAQALARALEEVTSRQRGADDRRPYPGLASFTEADVEYFFGREQEVEQMWRRLRPPRLQAIIGPSGAGKSSFLRAGLIPALPEGWRSLLCTPGSSPVMALAQALAPELAGDAEAVRELLRFEDPDVAVRLISRWRKRNAQALLIVDQFEELFTLNRPESQSRFADLLGRLAVDADVHVLLAMRDDFLFHCSSQPSLAPIFSELTPLRAPADPAMRRALVEPARKCGYRFEDEALTEEMLAEVKGGRGALPLLAFAVARLWEKRDGEKGVLTRAAYQQIGGVAGCLAQHAEATLERIGRDRQLIVRELFRNLVTAQGTRATREREELLSVIPGRDTAEAVLRSLVDARLVTSYEVIEGAGDESRRYQRVEIIHESLLSAWPRLVRWQAQDADGALLRDQLRQAAQFWQERGRPADLLWTGTSYREFRVWRERYPGRLTVTEEAFAGAMVARAGHRRRNLRLAIAAAFVMLIGVAGVIAFQAWKERLARLRADAHRLLALSRLEIDSNPTSALGLGIASLERADTPEARRIALEAFWRGPAYTILPGAGDAANQTSGSVAFSPDGRWLAAGEVITGRIALFSAAGGPPTYLGGPAGQVYFLLFGPASDVLLSGALGTNAVQVWSIPEGELIRSLQYGSENQVQKPLFVSPDGARIVTASSDSGAPLETERTVRLLSWSQGGDAPIVLGNLRGVSMAVDVDPTGRLVAYSMGGGIYVQPLNDLEGTPPRLLGSHADARLLRFDLQGKRLASGGRSRGIQVWSLNGNEHDPPLTFSAEEAVSALEFDPSGSWLATGHRGGTIRLWDLSRATAFPPLELVGQSDRIVDFAFHPDGLWLASANHDRPPRLWPLGDLYPRLLFRARGGGAYTEGMAFSPDGSWIAATMGEHHLHIWPLGGPGAEHREFQLSMPGYAVAVDPGGRRIIVGGGSGVEMVPLRGGSPEKLAGFRGMVDAVAFSPDGRYAAAGGGFAGNDQSDRFVRVWDLETATVRDLTTKEGIYSLFFLPDGRILFLTGAFSGPKDLYRWDTSQETADLLEREITRDRWPAADLNHAGDRFMVSDEPGMVLFDLGAGSSRRIETGGYFCWFGTPETVLVCGHTDGTVRIVPLDGGAPWDLVGHHGAINEAAMSPDGRWIASLAWDGELRLWPIPEGETLSTTLPLGLVLDRLRPLTNQRAVLSDTLPKGWSMSFDPPYPGWKTEPSPAR